MFQKLGVLLQERPSSALTQDVNVFGLSHSKGRSQKLGG